MASDTDDRNPLARLSRTETIDAWKAALTAARGNVTRAGKALGFNSKRHAFTLNRQLGCVAFARALRVAAQGHDKGRPWPKNGGNEKSK